MPRLRIDQFLSLLCICLSILLLPGMLPLASVESAPVVEPDVELITPAPLPRLKISEGGVAQLIDATALTNQLTASAAYVIDLPSASVLLEKKAHESRSPASTTKMMTALIARQHYGLEDVLPVAEEAFTQGMTMDLTLGEQVTVRDLLYGLLVQSGNDAAFVLANHHPLGYAGFIADMNDKAKQLHLENTYFTNPSGLDGELHRTTARDLGLIAREVMKDPVLKEMVGTKKIVVTDVSGQTKHYLFNTHELLGVEPGVVGVKTGTTEQAGETLITQVDRDGRSILIVLMGSQHRYVETKAIISWVFANYEWIDIAGKLE